MPLVFRGNSDKLYPDVDRRFTDIDIKTKCTYSDREEAVLSLAKSNQQWIIVNRCFIVCVSDDHHHGHEQ